MKKFSILLILLISVVFSLAAEDSLPAILSRGPLAHAGIEYLGVNALSSQYGEYLYGEDLITVYFTDEKIFFSDSWLPADCGLDGVLLLESSVDRAVAVYTDSKGWTAFFSFDAEAEYLCEFIKIYRSRQNYFLNIARDGIGFSFPALLELK